MIEEIKLRLSAFGCAFSIMSVFFLLCIVAPFAPMTAFKYIEIAIKKYNSIFSEQ